MSEWTFKEVKEIPPARSQRRSSENDDLFNQCFLRLEQTPATKWIEIHRSPSLTKKQAESKRDAIRNFFVRWHGNKFITVRIRPNGAPGAYALYVRRGENYK